MTKIFNDPAQFGEDSLRGFVDLHAGYVRPVPGGVARARRADRKVAIVVGGGSGHYPAFAGLVGDGFADAAVVGNIFTSPSSHFAYSVGMAAHSGAGVLFAYGNYAGDVMNFGLACERLGAAGVTARSVVVTDDIASAAAAEITKRRGIAGDFVVFKILSASAEAGHDIDEVERLGRLANDRTRTLGVAFSGCTFPGATEPLFTVPDGQMAIGLGIHGEPGLGVEPLASGNELAQLLVSQVLAEAPAGHGGRVAVLLNGLGATKYEELFLLWGSIAPFLRDAGLTIVEPEVGELVTSLEMAGVSLTITWLDAELEPLWTAPADTPAYRKGGLAAAAAATEASHVTEEPAPIEAKAPGSLLSQSLAIRSIGILEAVQAALHAAETELGRIDSIAGDGDHGRGMVRGIDSALAGARSAAAQGCGLGSVLQAAGDAWVEHAGGTSGVLWGTGLVAFAAVIGDESTPDPRTIVLACEAFRNRIVGLGKADPGDKTMVDAIEPFVRTLAEQIGNGIPTALKVAAKAAGEAAEATAILRPRVGRARPHAEKSIGTPDAGATSFALIVATIGSHGKVGSP